MCGFKFFFVNTVGNSLVGMFDPVNRLLCLFGAWDSMADSRFIAVPLFFLEGFTADLRAINPKTHEVRKMRLFACRLDVNVCTY